MAILGGGLDLWSKYAVFGSLYNEGKGGKQEIIPGAFSFTVYYSNVTIEGTGFLHSLRTISGETWPHVNRGALWGIGNNEPGKDYNTTFTVISLLAAVAILIWGFTSAKRDLFLAVSLGLILGGTIGNLYDRVVFQGVRDFLDFYLIDWPVFNIADCCLVCGAIALLIQAIFLQAPAGEKNVKNSVNTEEIAEIH